jgi:hypothetical protein
MFFRGGTDWDNHDRFVGQNFFGLHPGQVFEENASRFGLACRDASR